MLLTRFGFVNIPSIVYFFTTFLHLLYGGCRKKLKSSLFQKAFTNKIIGYIGEFEYIDDHRSGKIVIQLTGRLNKCGVISPRFNVKINDIEKWTENLLPARQFGYVILTTSAGIMDHEEARRKHVSGKILGFVY